MKLDIAIIGGGINGVGIARDASQRGLKVALFEKEDFGSGASSKSSKLAHGGVRYLEQFDFKLVKNCLIERDLLLKNAPEFVKPLPFIFPVYTGDRVPLWKVKAGLYLYDFLAKGSSLPKHTNISAEFILSKCHGLSSVGLQGGCLYYDGLMEDSLLVLENMLSAQDLGCHLYNYREVTGFRKEDNRITGLYYQDGIQSKLVEAKLIINTTGAWSKALFEKENIHTKYEISPTKGVHLVISPVVHETALLLNNKKDGRIFFLIPWHGYNLLGTTDTFYYDSPDQVNVSKSDQEYLLEAFAQYFPDIQPTIISSFAGIRPLVSYHSSSPSDLRRDHVIDDSVEGMVTLLGGKYTSYREMSEEIVDLAVKKLGVQYPSSKTKETPLTSRAAKEIQKILAENPEEGKTVCPLHPHRLAEITYAIKITHAKTLQDWYCRRTSIAYTECRGHQCVEAVADHFAKILDWTEEQKKDAIAEYIYESQKILK